MTAPVFVADPAAVAGASVGAVLRLEGDEGHHATVQRIAVGEEVVLADGAGHGVRATVVAVGRGWLEARAEELVLEAEPPLRFELVQALAKGGRDEAAVEACVELGVDGVSAWQADRSISRWKDDKVTRGVRKWAQVALAATKQSRRLRSPAVGFVGSTTQLAQHLREHDAALVLHEEADTPIAAARLPEAGSVAVVVGPEGGISPEELAELRRAGAQVVRLGPHVLRTSTAGPAALAVLGARTRWA